MMQASLVQTTGTDELVGHTGVIALLNGIHRVGV